MAPRSKKEESSRSRIPDHPPPAASENGRRIAKIPTVMNTNCMRSVRVMDHMPPSTEYAITTAPPRRMAQGREIGNRTEKIAAYAAVEVTAIMIVYASITKEDAVAPPLAP